MYEPCRAGKFNNGWSSSRKYFKHCPPASKNKASLLDGKSVSLAHLMDTSVSKLSQRGSAIRKVPGRTKLATLLEVLFPSYSFISRAVPDILGLNPALMVSFAIVLFTFRRAFPWVYGLRHSLYASIDVPIRSVLFSDIRQWIEEYKGRKHWSHLVVAGYRNTGAHQNTLPPGEIFNFAKWAATCPLAYEPHIGTNSFIWEGRLFVLESCKPKLSEELGGKEEVLKVKTWGRNPEPIQKLLQHIRKWKADQRIATTSIYCPRGNKNGSYSWHRAYTRHTRSLESVMLNPEIKNRILVDINQFIIPGARKWYATRGIPYRRGYLFYGPPGTGKSSFSFALAGCFGLDIYFIPMGDSTLTDGDLDHLFSTLPSSCVVELDDIDVAGLRCDRKEERHDRIMRLPDDTGEIGASPKKNETRSNISVSGLLTALDGVASPEGRLLMLTTNHPQDLPEALKRPGRIDMTVEFKLATASEAREMFVLMYRDESVPEDERRFSSDQISAMAEQFSKLVPEGTLSAASLQNYMIKRKDDPEKALSEGEAWINKLRRGELLNREENLRERGEGVGS